MTIHQAKGLEFPVVFLYRCESSPESSSTKAREISVSKELGLLFKVPPKDNPLGNFKIPPLLVINNFIEEAKDLAEIKRLLYVGITRAISKLCIVYDKNDKENYDQKSFISLLKQVFPALSENMIYIEDDVKFLRKKDNEYYNVTNRVKVDIKIISFIEENNIQVGTDEEIDKHYSIDTQKIESESESQIISATKISTFEKCPLKYHLTYNIGLAKLLKLLPSSNERKSKLFEYLADFKKQDKDEDILLSEKNLISYKSSEKLGQIVHKILEKNIPLEKVREFLSAKEFHSLKKFKDEECKMSIISLLENYYDSKVFEELSSYKNYKNEFEILVKEENVILKGIIDKIIFKDDSIFIIDYKTDFVDESEAQKHYLEYEIQMKFYLYISMKFFEKIKKFSSRLIFLRNPSLYFDLNYERGDLSNLKNEIFNLVRGIIDNNSDKNLKHCPNCIYFINNKNCIIT
jgi:ATP-dependent helicase/nuclease subunit A